MSITVPHSFAITMIDFCKKSVYTLFNIASTTLEDDNSISAEHHRATQPPVIAGAGLIFLTTGEIPKPSNVIESASLINRPKKAEDLDANRPAKRDRMGIGLRVLDGADFDGLASCTESLGFESCNERSTVSDEFGISDQIVDFQKLEKPRVSEKSKRLKQKKRTTKKSYPPPLSSLNDDGKPAFFLRPVRKNGRLELTEVKIHRQESLRACREDGRLRLHLVESDDYENDLIDVNNCINVKDDDDDYNKAAGVVDVKKQEVVEEDWKFPANSCGGGEDCRWLHEMAVSHGHHHHNMHGWGHQCVTIR